MQHLLLVVSILLLTIIAGNGRLQNHADDATNVMKIEKVREEKRLPVNEVETDFSIRGVVIDVHGI